MTAYALGANETGKAGVVVEDDGLMTTVAARYFATSAADAQLLVELRVDNGVTIQMVRIQELRLQLTHQLLQVTDATLGHITLQAEDEVVDDAVAILHDGGAYLYVAAA